MNHCDLILHLVEQLMAEREKNIILQQEQKEQKQQQQMPDTKNVKTKE